jgi:transcriptional regulator with XRE-family HTH domain
MAVPSSLKMNALARGGRVVTNRDVARAQQAQRINKLLLDRGMRQSELARRSGLPRYTISRFVRGENVGSAEVLKAIADALGVQPSEIIDFEEMGDLDDLPTGIHLSPISAGNVWLRVNMTVTQETAAVVNLILNSPAISKRQLTAISAALYSEGD